MDVLNQINIGDLQNQIPEIITLIKSGKHVLITENDKPLAEITPVKLIKRIPGLNRGGLEYISDDFDNPLSDEFWNVK
jgi:antitoxin (DNA-binding transcriptional repressor) of toxin-antitoxin stability system